MHHPTRFGASAYSAIGIETGIAAADPLGLVIMLYDGAIQAIVRAEGAMALGDIEGRGAFTSKAIDIIQQGLAASLDTRVGGTLAESLAALYDYMGRRLLIGNLRSELAAYSEVRKLLVDLRESWLGLRRTQPAPAPIDEAGPRSNRIDSLRAYGRSLAA